MVKKRKFVNPVHTGADHDLVKMANSKNPGFFTCQKLLLHSPHGELLYGVLEDDSESSVYSEEFQVLILPLLP